MTKKNLIIPGLIASILVLGITATSMNIGQQVATAASDHGDEVSSAAQIIGPEIKGEAQKDPSSVTDAAKIIGPEISAIAKPLTK